MDDFSLLFLLLADFFNESSIVDIVFSYLLVLGRYKHLYLKPFEFPCQ